jgi:hypothetical protein
MSQVILTEDEVRAATNARLAERMGIAKDKVLSYKGKEVYVVATTKNFEQNCKPTLDAMRQDNEVHIVDEAPKRKRRGRNAIVNNGPIVAPTEVVDPVLDEGENGE